MLGFDSDEDEDRTPVAASMVSMPESSSHGASPSSTGGTPRTTVADEIHRESRAVACRLEPIVRIGRNVSDGTSTALEKIRHMARWMHGVRRDAHELINHHVLRVLEAGGTLPDLHENAVVYRFLVAVTTMPGASTTYAELDAEIATTRSAGMSKAPSPRWTSSSSRSRPWSTPTLPRPRPQLLNTSLVGATNVSVAQPC